MRKMYVQCLSTLPDTLKVFNKWDLIFFKKQNIKKIQIQVKFVDKHNMEYEIKEQEGVKQNYRPTRECFKLDLEVIGMD